MNELQKAVLAAFASEFSFYLKAHGFHWNLTDKDFPQYHGFFGDIYDEVYGSLDGFAERCRATQVFVPASLSGLLAISQIADCTESPPPSKDAMLSELYADNEKLVGIMRDAYNICDMNSEFGFANFLADRMDAHRKHGWMLRSSM